MSEARAAFERLAGLADRDLDPAMGALWIAAEEYPGLAVEEYLGRLDALARAAAPRLAAASGGAGRVDALNHFLFEEQRFHGNAADYYDPRNSYLNQVIDRRCGIPITLSLVYLAVGRRLGLDVRGISFPGHFLVKCVEEEEILVDAFAGSRLTRAACQERLRAALGRDVPLTEALLRAASPRQILVRVLANLKQIFAARADWARALACSERTLLLLPDAPEELHARAGIHARLGWFTAAAADLERLVQVAPDHPLAEAALRQGDLLRRRAGPLH